jgi:branched-chain amino acid aminotransferase
VLLDEIRVPDIEVGEKPLLPTDLDAADEVFITSTTRDLLPVEEIEGAKVGRTLAAQTALAAAFQARLRQYVAEHKPAQARV